MMRWTFARPIPVPSNSSGLWSRGQLRYGFVEVRGEACRQVTLVAFSCKGRGWCPSCTTRRAIEAGVHAEASLPMVSHRQWTLSVPKALRS